MINWSVWDRLERQLLQQEFTDIALAVLLAGGDNGAATMPPGLDVLVDWDVFNTSALDWLRIYFGDMQPGIWGQSGAFDWAQRLNGYTRRTIIKEIDSWVREGAPLPVLEQRLASLFDSARARRVAVTEVTRIYASGNLMAWQSSGVVTGKRWMTAVDERVCPICGPLHNTLVEIDRTWEFTQAMLDANPQLAKALRGPAAFVAPPAHVMCRCWLQPVVFEALEPAEIERARFGR